MTFRMDQFLVSLSAGLDAVEGELLGATTNHGKRVAILALKMGRFMNWSDEELASVAACALMHDNALTEHIPLEEFGDPEALDLTVHCLKGEKNVLRLPFLSDVKGFVQYHHEFVDRSGPFGIDARETPPGAQLIAIADHVDILNNLQRLPECELEGLRAGIRQKRGSYYTNLSADALLAVLDRELLYSFKDEHVHDSFARSMPAWTVDLPAACLIDIAKTVACITDYKSRFTAKHSIQIANRAYWMANSYGFCRETCAKIYLAAAFHDIGKLMTPVRLLEKPGGLTGEEYKTVQKHVYWSYIMLKDVEGFDEICRWAVTHHRQISGGGYPALPERYLELDFVSKMIACIDIYQALREERPYHRGRTHKEAIGILQGMAGRGQIDGQITRDLDREMGLFAEEEVPEPQAVDQALRGASPE